MTTEKNDEMLTLIQDSFCNWYLRIWNECEDAKKRLKEQAAKMEKEITNRQKALQWKLGEQFQQRITAMVEAAGGKKRSVNLLQGTAGYRKNPDKMKILDMDKAVAWAEENIPDDVIVEKRVNTTPLKDNMKTTGEVPDGCEYLEAYDKFYPQVELPALSEGKEE